MRVPSPRVADVPERLLPVGRDLLRAAQVPVDQRALEQRREVGQGQEGHEDAGQQRAPGHAPSGRGHPGAEEDGQAERHQGDGPLGVAEGQAHVGGLRHRPEGGAERRRVVEGVGGDGDGRPHEGEEGEVGPEPPPGDGRRHEGEHGQGEADEDQPGLLGVGHRRLHPGAEAVSAVEEPVPQAPGHLRGERGRGDGLDRLGRLQDRRAVAAVDQEGDDPPDLRHPHEEARAQEGAGRPPRRRLPQSPHRERDPQQGAQAGEGDGAWR